MDKKAATADDTGKKTDVDHWGEQGTTIQGTKTRDVTVKSDGTKPINKRLATKTIAVGDIIFREGDIGDEA